MEEEGEEEVTFTAASSEIQKACPPRCCSRLVPPPARDRQCTAPWRQCPQTNLGQHMEASHQPWPPTDAMPANLGRPTLATDAMSTNSLHQPWPANNWPQACWPTLARPALANRPTLANRPPAWPMDRPTDRPPLESHSNLGQDKSHSNTGHLRGNTRQAKDLLWC